MDKRVLEGPYIFQCCIDFRVPYFSGGCSRGLPYCFFFCVCSVANVNGAVCISLPLLSSSHLGIAMLIELYLLCEEWLQFEGDFFYPNQIGLVGSSDPDQRKANSNHTTVTDARGHEEYYKKSVLCTKVTHKVKLCSGYKAHEFALCLMNSGANTNKQRKN